MRRGSRRLKSKVDYKFYSQLEAILGQEVVSNDESEVKEEEEEQEAAGTVMPVISVDQTLAHLALRVVTSELALAVTQAV